MTNQLQLRLKPEQAYDELRLKIEASTALDVDVNRIKRIDINRRSIDARQRQVMVNLTITAHIDEIDETLSQAQPVEYKPLAPEAKQAIVVGAGPAGLFAALRLIELGIKPILLERGKDVDNRRTDLAAISREGKVDPNSNYCFGEGGAGAFSDGKLYTRSKKRGSVEKVLNIFVQHGANPDILADAHPHIGSDKLPGVIKAMRQTIIDCGGEVHFGERVDSLLIDHGKCQGVEAVDSEGNAHAFHGPVILATGHSARDVYSMLKEKGVGMEAKGIAVGVRVEHPQALIDSIFYHSPKGRGKHLPPAEYSLLTRVDDRAVYSFCMCPGGYIIPATNEPGLMVVNGMSPSNRGTQWANSGIVVEVLPEDLPGDDPLKMMKFQRSIEKSFFSHSGDGTQNAPAQRLTDFIEGKESETLPKSSYTAGIHPGQLERLLPIMVAKRLQGAFADFGKKYKGYVTPEAIVVGNETRTSSPVRIIRDNATLQHATIQGLYPCGEGAGYAGGIASAAIDGERCATALAEQLNTK
ncbi:MAG: hypothetical protein NC102_05170 [Clostridium sp.]|nr:hypothetical protein [Clostridium sp.]